MNWPWVANKDHACTNPACGGPWHDLPVSSIEIMSLKRLIKVSIHFDHSIDTNTLMEVGTADFGHACHAAEAAIENTIEDGNKGNAQEVHEHLGGPAECHSEDAVRRNAAEGPQHLMIELETSHKK